MSPQAETHPPRRPISLCVAALIMHSIFLAVLASVIYGSRMAGAGASVHIYDSASSKVAPRHAFIAATSSSIPTELSPSPPAQALPPSGLLAVIDDAIMPSSLERLHLRSWRVKGASPPPVRAPPPSGKLLDLSKALVVAEPMHVARRLATVDVSPSDNLQSKLDNAGNGDTLVLADGTYLGSGYNVLEISKDITIRAQNSGQAILDGENARRVIYITSGTVTLEGLNITRGSTSVRSLLHSELAWTLTNSIAPLN